MVSPPLVDGILKSPSFVRMSVRPSHAISETVCYFLFSLRSHWRPKESRLSIHLSVAQFLENHSLLFSETLQLVRACKRDKNVPSAFLKNSHFAHFGQKLNKIGHFVPKCLKMVGFFAFFHNPFIRIS